MRSPIIRAYGSLTDIAVPLVLLLRRRVDRRPIVGLGFEAPRTAWHGVLVVGGAATAVFAAGTALGWVRWVAVDPTAVVLFLLVNTVLALCLEAVPEELALRGYAYRTLNQRWRRWTASAGTLGLFVLVSGASSVVGAVTGQLAGVPVPPPSFAPGGQDPVAYAVLLLFFGATLQLARVTTGSLWACVAAHLTFLTANRLVLVPEAFDAGVVTSLRPEAELLVLVYLVLAGIGFVVIARTRGRRIGWRERDPEPLPTETPARV